MAFKGEQSLAEGEGSLSLALGLLLPLLEGTPSPRLTCGKGGHEQVVPLTPSTRQEGLVQGERLGMLRTPEETTAGPGEGGEEGRGVYARCLSAIPARDAVRDWSSLALIRHGLA